MPRRGVFLTDDYLIRVINTALAALAQIVGLKTASQFIEARLQIDRALEEIIGLRAELIKRLNDASILDALRVQDGLDTNRLWLVAALFKEEGEVLERQGRPDSANQSYLRALSFFLEVALQGGTDHFDDPDDQILFLSNKFAQASLPPELRFSLFTYEEQAGRYDRAAIALQSLLEQFGTDAAIRDEAIGFYRRLQAKADLELISGGLSREQVESRLAGLEKPEAR